MNTSEADLILQQVLKMTHEMLVHAREENWIEVAKLEGDRQQSLMESLAGTDIEKVGEIGQLIQQIIDVDRETQELVMKARNEIRDDLIQLNKDKDGAKAYGTR